MFLSIVYIIFITYVTVQKHYHIRRITVFFINSVAIFVMLFSQKKGNFVKLLMRCLTKIWSVDSVMSKIVDCEEVFSNIVESIGLLQYGLYGVRCRH